MVGKELQPPGLVGGGQPFEKQTSEEAREHLDGEKKAGPAGDPAFTVQRDPAARNKKVNVRVVAPTPTIP